MKNKNLLDKRQCRGESLTQLVKALCFDYESRKKHIIDGDISRRVRMEYEYINALMVDGAGEVVGWSLAEKFIDDIGKCRGYAKSEVDGYSERAYKIYKSEVMDNIARKLHLLD